MRNLPQGPKVQILDSLRDMVLSVVERLKPSVSSQESLEEEEGEGEEEEEEEEEEEGERERYKTKRKKKSWYDEDEEIMMYSLGLESDVVEFEKKLFKAALWDNAELLEDLLNSDQLCHINCQDAWGRTPLHAAATTESSRCLRILLQAGADPNLASGPRAEGRTCLHISSEHGAMENIRLLLDHGADLLAKDANGLTALDLAEQGEHTQCMAVLKNAAGTLTQVV
ncbi:uncharacterized protein [Penaeus vannamei]|uniref:uncharacterized protein isoform X1 n=1 Tax=Penaeus vannamei TaxID=6689 RepID=UPI00387F7A74